MEMMNGSIISNSVADLSVMADMHNTIEIIEIVANNNPSTKLLYLQKRNLETIFLIVIPSFMYYKF